LKEKKIMSPTDYKDYTDSEQGQHDLLRAQNEEGQAMVEIKPPDQLVKKEQSYINTILKWVDRREKAIEVASSVFREHRMDVILWLAQNGVEIPLELADHQLHNSEIQEAPNPLEMSTDGIPPLTAQDL
jgi:hypothetical protein